MLNLPFTILTHAYCLGEMLQKLPYLEKTHFSEFSVIIISFLLLELIKLLNGL